MRGRVLSEFEAHPLPSIDLREFTNEEGELMAQGPPVVVHFKEVPNSERVLQSIQARCERLASEFDEVSRFEITFTPLGTEVTANGHATGKNTNVATQASGKNLRAAADQVIEKIERQLRKLHDKRIFAQRREAQRNPAKRSPSE
jgi:ribosomal subunit interface protein